MPAHSRCVAGTRHGGARTRAVAVLALVALCAAGNGHAAAAGGARAPVTLGLPRATHGWKARLLWATDLMDAVVGGRAHGWKVPLLVDLRVTAHRRLGDALESYTHIDLIRIAGSNPSRDAGDLQTLDNLAAHHAWRLYRAFWQLHDPARHWTLRLGWQGYDELFGLVPDGADLINSSFGQMPTGSQAGLPIWPQTAPGIAARWHPGAFYVLGGLWSGVPRDPAVGHGLNLPRHGDGALQALETGLYRRGSYKLALGLWRLHRGAALAAAHQGVYALADVTLLHGGGEALGGFLQWGRTRPGVDAVSRYLGCGLRLTTAAHSRISLGIARARLATGYRRRHAGAPRAETAFELTWRMRVRPWLALQPDLQYIAHPALAPRASHALVAGLRLDGRF